MALCTFRSPLALGEELLAHTENINENTAPQARATKNAVKCLSPMANCKSRSLIKTFVNNIAKDVSVNQIISIITRLLLGI